MSAAHATTLLELVQAVQDCSRSDAEVVATITHMLDSGSVVLVGSFAGQWFARRNA